MRKHRPQMGYSLGGTMLFLVLAALLWEGVFFQMAGYLRAEKALIERHVGREGCTRAMAWSLALLETGVPPQNPYLCRMVPTDNPANVYVAVFRRTGNGQYTVGVRPAAFGDESLPLAPTTFTATRSGRERVPRSDPSVNPEWGGPRRDGTDWRTGGGTSGRWGR